MQSQAVIKNETENSYYKVITDCERSLLFIINYYCLLLRQVLKSVAELYYKVRQVLQSASGITKCDRLLLQSASGITKCDSYYKVRRNTLNRIEKN